MESIITQILSKFNSQIPMLNRLRYFANQSFYMLFFLFSIAIAFFAGRTYKFMENKPGFVFEQEAQSSPSHSFSGNLKVNDVPTIVASKGGKKYYFVWCKGAENIKEKNKRYFKTEDSAKKAGYTLAASCK